MHLIFWTHHYGSEHVYTQFHSAYFSNTPSEKFLRFILCVLHILNICTGSFVFSQYMNRLFNLRILSICADSDCIFGELYKKNSNIIFFTAFKKKEYRIE
jgi:hypothetical protein